MRKITLDWLQERSGVAALSLKREALRLTFVFMCIWTCTMSALAESPPFEGAEGKHVEEPLGGIIPPGSLGRHSTSQINAVAGTFWHNAAVEAVCLGVNGMRVSDEICRAFSVPVGGMYVIRLAGRVSGDIWAVGGSPIVGYNNSVFDIYIESRVTRGDTEVPGSIGSWIPLYSEDLDVTWFLKEAAWETFKIAFDIGDIVTSIDLLKGLYDPVYSWQNEPFLAEVTAYLEAGVDYQWELYMKSVCAAGALGVAYQYSLIDLNLALEEVSLSPASGLPTGLVLSATVSPESEAIPGQDVLVSGTVAYNTGGTVPVGTVDIDTGENSFTAPIKNGTFSRVIQAPHFSRQISITASEDYYGLQGSIVKNISIKQDDGGSGYTLYGTTMCRAVRTSDPYDPVDETHYLRRTDVRVYMWVHLTYLYVPVRTRVKWYAPNGDLYRQNDSDWSEDPAAHGYDYYEWWKFWHYIWIKDNAAASYPGVWQCKLYVDHGTGWRYRATETFVLGYDFTEHRMARDVQTSEPYLPIGETNVFKQTDTKALTWANFDNVAERLEVMWEFYDPTGKLHSAPTHTVPDPAPDPFYEWYRFWGWIEIGGTSAANKCGDWRVNVSVKNAAGQYEKIYTDYFRLVENPFVSPSIAVECSPASPVETQFISLNVSASDNTYLEAVTLYWNDGEDHELAWHDLKSSGSPASLQASHIIGPFAAGRHVECWAVAEDTSGIFARSEKKVFFVAQETLSSPRRPDGPQSVRASEAGVFSTGDSLSTLDHPVEYQFDWGDGYQSNWGNGTDAHTWFEPGVYQVKARARCQLDTSRMSAWCDPLPVMVEPPVSSLAYRYRLAGILPAQWCTSVDISPDKTKVFARAHFGDWNEGVRVYSANTYDHILDLQNLPNVPWTILASADGGYLYASHYYGSAVVKLDGATGEVVASIPVGPWPGHLAFDSARRYLYVGVNNPGRGVVGWVSRIDTATDSVVGKVDLNGEPGACILLSPEEDFLYVLSTMGGPETLFKIATAAMTVVDSLTLPGVGNAALSVGGDGRFLYLADSAAGTVRVIESATLTETDHYFIPDVLNFSIAPCGDRALAICHAPGTSQVLIHVFDLLTGTIAETLVWHLTGDTSNVSAGTPVVWDPAASKAFIPLMAEGGGVLVVQRSSYCSIRPVTGTSNYRIEWPSFAGKRYQPQGTRDLTSGPWESIGPPVDGTGELLYFEDTPAQVMQRFYRLEIVDQ